MNSSKAQNIKIITLFILILLIFFTLVSFDMPVSYAEETTGSLEISVKLKTGDSPVSEIETMLYYGGTEKYSATTDSTGKATFSSVKKQATNYEIYIKINGTAFNTMKRIDLNESRDIFLYQISFEDSDGTALHEKMYYPENATSGIKLKSTDALGLNYSAHTGYTFAGWKEKGSASSTVYSDTGTIAVKQDTVLVATWTEKQYIYSIDGSGSVLTLSEDNIKKPFTYSNITDVISAIEQLRDPTKPCTIQLGISQLNDIITLTRGTYNIYTKWERGVESLIENGSIKVSKDVVLNFYGKIYHSESSSNIPSFSIKVSGGTLSLKENSSVQGVLLVGTVQDTQKSQILLDGYTQKLELGYRYDESLSTSYDEIDKRKEGYQTLRQKVLGYTLMQNVEETDVSRFTLVGDDSSKWFGMAYNKTKKCLYIEEKFEISYLLDFTETEKTRLSGTLPSAKYILKGYSYSVPALPTSTALRGHDFDGFYLGTEKYEENATFSPTDDTVLKAKFTPKTYKIIYTNLKGSTSPKIEKHTYMTDTTLTSITTTGYTFSTFKIDNKDLKTPENTFVLGGEDYISDITVKAVWTLDAPIVTPQNYNGIYDGKSHPLTVTTFHLASTPIKYLYEWSFDGKSLGDLATVDVKHVADTGTYHVKVIAWDGELFSAPTDTEVLATITPIAITIKLQDKEQIRGRIPKSFSATLVEGTFPEGESIATLALTCSSDFDPDVVGTYTITATSKNTDYTITFIDGTYTVIPVDTDEIIVTTSMTGGLFLALLTYFVAMMIRVKTKGVL